MTPLAMDLCSGSRGWGEGFESAGWIVLGVDKRPFREKCSPPQLVRDITTLDPDDYRGLIDLVVASPPCEEFSKWDTQLFPGTPRPDLTLVNFCFEFAAALGVPIVLENVRGLQKLIGPAAQHYGSFYLWGDVPTLMPYIPGRQGRPKMKWCHRSPRLRAKIPLELAYTVANFHRVRLGAAS